ncbi:hypothetical protein [Pseudomonas sp. NPDC087336]|jgi:hypothetical protein|uniref:hypothetical protein n=1 Tax=Pseudomonas sp. NPDC087336 TaxID=3364436 RepID=UPI00380914BD
MQGSNSTYATETTDSTHSVILNQRTSAPGHDEPILFQQSCLGLTDDRTHVVLRRYFEQYSPTTGTWVEYIHRVPIAEFTQWIMAHGDLRIECSEDLPDSPLQSGTS